MAHNQILGKCCYCGHKSLVGKGELKCDACGAPIRQFLSLDAVKEKPPTAKLSATKPTAPISAGKAQKETKKKSSSPRPKLSPNFKKKKSNIKRLFDLVDDIVDIFD